MAKKPSTKVVAGASESPEETLFKIMAEVTPEADKIKRMVSTSAKASAATRRLHAVMFASCVEHAMLYGNVTPMINAVNSLGPTGNGTSVVKWAIAMGPCRHAKDKHTQQDTLGFNAKPRDALVAKGSLLKGDDNGTFYTWVDQPTRDAFIRTLVETPYWVLTPPVNAFKPFSLPKAMHALLEKADKIKNDPELKDVKGNDFTGYDALAKAIAITEGSATIN